MLDDKQNNSAVLKVIFLAALLSGLSLYLQHNIDINIADEGYLLYGAVQTAAGKVPIRDFHAYDPGRYYWMAGWSLVFGDGLLAMRFNLAIFSGIGLCFGLLAARRMVRSFWGLVPVGVLLLVWIFPRYHPFETTFAMATVFFATRLIEAPTLRRYFSTGVFVGLAAFFGRNLGLYGFLAISATALYIWLRLERDSLPKRYALFMGGIFLGYSPMFFMVLFIPGFFSAFLNSILFIFKIRATNLPLPVPWPWIFLSSGVGGTVLRNYLSSGVGGSVLRHYLLLGSLFLAMPLFYLLCLVRLPFIRKEDIKRNALLTASLFTGIFYMHYVFSRADINHLAKGIHPLILAMLALVCVRRGSYRKVLIIITGLFLALASTFTILPEKPFVKKNITERGNFAQYPIRGEKIWIKKGHVIAISTIERIVRQNAAPEDGVFLAPVIPTMYYILDRESPTWNTYYLFKGSPEEQKRIISALEEHNVQWAVVGDIPLDGRDELRFSRTYDMVWAYLQRNYELVDPLWNIPGYVFIHKRKGNMRSSN